MNKIYSYVDINYFFYLTLFIYKFLKLDYKTNI